MKVKFTYEKRMRVKSALILGCRKNLKVDFVLNDFPGMGNELTARHELVLRAVSKSIAHATMPARNPDTALHSL